MEFPALPIALNEDILLILLGGLVLIVFLVYMIYKDSMTTRKLKDYEFAIEELNRQLFLLEKNQKGGDEKIMAEVEAEINRLFSKELKGIADTLMSSINEIKSIQANMKNNLETRMDRIEERTKEYLSVPSSPTLDENKVQSLHKAGYTKEEIAKELHVSVSEVSFVLNILNLS